MCKMKKLCIFDFDGTLVDTATDVAAAFQEAAKINGFPVPEKKEIFEQIGQNLDVIVHNLLPKDAQTERNIDKYKKSYRELYKKSNKDNTAPFEGMIELLAELKNKGYSLAVNSNKPQEILGGMVYQYFPPNTFDYIIGYVEGRPSKPDPYGVNVIIEQAEVSKENVIYIGDGLNDILTAHNAGVEIIYVTWGPCLVQGLEKREVKNIVDSVEELRRIV